MGDEDRLDTMAEAGGDGAQAVQIPPGKVARTEGGPGLRTGHPNGVPGGGRRALLDAGDGLGRGGVEDREELAGEPSPGDVCGVAPGGRIVR